MQGPLLTARQLEEILGVDKSTIYRMAGDGRLPAVKVGRQWRFPADRIEQMLTAQPSVSPSPDLQTVTDLAAEALGVMMVVTDMEGNPLSRVSNPSPWFAERGSRPDVLAGCIAEWRDLAADRDLTPTFRSGRFGFQCARAFLRTGNELVGTVLVGGIAEEGAEPNGFHLLNDEARSRVLSTLPKVASAISRLIERSMQ
jgi:excisionase family DNA binding protein